jgi:threonine synthase
VHDNDNLTIERPTFVTHLECAMEGDHYPADQIHNLSKAGKPLLVRYDLAAVKKALTKEALSQRPADMWRYREMLPVRKCADIVSLGEVMTPLIRLPKLAKKLGGGEIIVKDEGRLPTGSFKARGLVMAVSMGKALGIKHMAMPTNGNAGAALAATRRAAASRPRSSVPPTRRRSTSARSSCRARPSIASTDSLMIAARSSARARPRPAGSIPRP